MILPNTLQDSGRWERLCSGYSEKTEYSHDDNDRLLTENGFSYTYDNNGNMLTKSGNGEQWQLDYNALNRLTRANISTPQDVLSVEYLYDHDGLRIGKTLNGEYMQYVLDKNRVYAQVLEERSATGELLAGYVYGKDLLSRTTGGASDYYLYDGFGSVRGLSNTSGSVTDSYAYDAYGMLLDGVDVDANPYRYRGEQYDAELDAYYLRARYYQPGTGRFLTTDPVEGVPSSPLTLHRYVYGNDAPTTFLDPSGEMSLAETMATVGIVGTLGNLSHMALSYTELGQDLYATFAEYVYPEAYIAGVNAAGTIPFAYQNFVYLLFDQSPIPYDVREIFNAVIGAGLELLISVGSGEAALFKTHSFGWSLPMPSLSAGLELYDGFVFNLWNGKDYRGPFQSISFSMDTSAPFNIGLNVFWDAERKLGGPWGGSNAFLSKSWGLYSPVNVGKLFINYEMIGEPLKLERSSAVAAIYAMLFATKVIESIDNGGAGAVMTGASWLFEVTTWANIEQAHHYWNQKAPLYSVENRREYPRGWVKSQVSEGYHSGPSHLRF